MTWLNIAGLTCCAASLGTAHVCARLAFGQGVNLLTAATTRAGCASLIVLALLLSRGRAWRIPSRQALGCVILGVFVVGQTLLVQIAVKRLPVTVALLLFYTYPFFTATAASLLGDHRFDRRLALSLAAAFAGLALVLGVSPEALDGTGVAAAVGAALVFTGTLTFTPRLAPGLEAPLRTFLMKGAATLMVATAAAVSGNLQAPTSALAWGGLAGLSVFYGAGIVGVFLLLPRMGPVQAAVVMNLEPVFVAGIAWMALGEQLSGLQAAGAAIVVAAVMGAQVKR
jgi:probable blue pigment (indigoidine) exporter